MVGLQDVVNVTANDGIIYMTNVEKFLERSRGDPLHYQINVNYGEGKNVLVNLSIQADKTKRKSQTIHDGSCSSKFSL